MNLNRDLLYGITAGGAAVVFSAAIYSIDREIFVGSMVYWGSTMILILFVLLAIMHARSGRRELKGFKELLRSGFIVYIVGNLMYYIFLFNMFNYIDPELPKIQREQLVEWMIERHDGDENAVQVKRLKVHDYEMTFKSTFFAYAQGLIFGFIIAAGLAYLLKEKSYFDDTENQVNRNVQ